MAAGDPTGIDLCSGTTDGDTITPEEEREITIDTPVELTSGVEYAIVIRVLDAGAGDSIAWWRKTSNNYADGIGVYSVNSGGSWTQEATDFWFATKAAGVEKDTHKANDVSAPAATATIWRGQTFTASSTYTISSIVLKLSKGGSPGTITVSIKAVAAVPTKATTPAPGNTATDVTLDQATLTWVDGGGATSYDVYYGTSAAAVAAADTTDETGVYLGNQAGLSLTVTGITSGSPYAYLVSRYWRIDSVNATGTTTGTAWSFTTIRLSPPTVTYFYSTTGQYYQLLVQADGTYGDPPGIGVEDTDYIYLAAGYEPNFIKTTRRLVAAAYSKIWYEEI